MTATLERTTFSTSRLLEFFSEKELAMQMGHSADWWPLAQMTAARHMLGDFQGELESAEVGFDQFPGEAHFFFAKARALAAMGQTEAVDKVIDEFLRVQTRGGSAGCLMSATAVELRAHGYRKEAEGMALRSVEWFEDHPSALSEGSESFAVELWALGYPEAQMVDTW